MCVFGWRRHRIDLHRKRHAPGCVLELARASDNDHLALFHNQRRRRRDGLCRIGCTNLISIRNRKHSNSIQSEAAITGGTVRTYKSGITEQSVTVSSGESLHGLGGKRPDSPT